MELQRMKDKDFKRLSNFIYTNYGIKMPSTKKVMLEGRLRKRLKANNISSYEEYCNHLFSEEGLQNEVIPMIDAVSTNKTDFFREPFHFEFMTSTFLPEFEERSNGKPLQVWSAAASSGEEPYSISMIIQDFFERNKTFNYSVYGTDISTSVLKAGSLGVYDESRIEKIPLSTKRKYFLKSKDPLNKTVRIIPELRRKMTFQRLNLMDESYFVPHDFDVIFCRNVLIYFDKETQEKVIQRLCQKLKPGGYFFLGHSESITGMDVPLRTVKPTIFQKF